MYVLPCNETDRVLRQGRKNLTEGMIHLLSIALKESATACTEESVSGEDKPVL